MFNVVCCAMFALCHVECWRYLEFIYSTAGNWVKQREEWRLLPPTATIIQWYTLQLPDGGSYCEATSGVSLVRSVPKSLYFSSFALRSDIFHNFSLSLVNNDPTKFQCFLWKVGKVKTMRKWLIIHCIVRYSFIFHSSRIFNQIKWTSAPLGRNMCYDYAGAWQNIYLSSGNVDNTQKLQADTGICHLIYARRIKLWALVGAFSIIVKTDCETDGSFEAIKF